MTLPNLSFVTKALSKLEQAVDEAALSASRNQMLTDGVAKRISLYRDIIRRQRLLIAQVEGASERSDWKEVSRLTSLVHGASVLLKVDVDSLVTTLRKGAPGGYSAQH